MLFSTRVTLHLLFAIIGLRAVAQPTIFEINRNLGKGINMGNMFEAPNEGEWGNPFRDDYFKIIASLGFNHVRIPIRWDTPSRTLQTPPYTINASFLERIKYVIDKALVENLYVIVNMHHHDLLFQDPDGQKEKFISQWTQIANYFKGYDHRLLFEIMNEPNTNLTPAKWNVFFKDALAVIRKTNPTRAVLMGTDPWGGLAGIPDMIFPNDDYTILTIHDYEPFTFTHQGAEWVNGADAWLGTKWQNTTIERNEIISSFAFAQAFAKEKNKPIHIGEFGAYSKGDLDSRIKWTNFLARWFESQGMSWAYWEWSAGFGIYNPATNQVLTSLADALIKTPMFPETKQTTIPVFESSFGINDGWNLYLQSNAAASLSRINGSGVIEITRVTDQGWHVQLVKAPVKLKKGSRYLVTVRAASTVPVSFTNYIGKNGDPWNSYSGYKSISTDNTPGEYIYTFTMTSPNDDFARVVFDLGSKISKITIAGIKIEELKDVVSDYKQSISDRIKIFPNPAKDYIMISGIRNDTAIKITDALGRVIINKIYGESLDVSDLSSGVYFVEVWNKENYGVKKFVKN